MILVPADLAVLVVVPVVEVGDVRPPASEHVRRAARFCSRSRALRAPWCVLPAAYGNDTEPDVVDVVKRLTTRSGLTRS